MSKRNYVGEALIHVPVPESRLADVYALLGGVASLALAAANVAPVSGTNTSDDSEAAASTVTGEPSVDATSASGVDAAGTPFDPARHTGTKVKSGLWRMKTGLSRPAGEGEDAIPAAGASTTAAGAAPAAVEDDDEFAEFTAAVGATSAAAPVARKWTDADLSKLTNQAAKALGGADAIKAEIAKFVTPGETPHSRNIPEANREPFAQAVEKVAGIEYAG